MTVIVEQPYNTIMKGGQPWQRRFRLTDTDTGLPIDISAYTFKMSVRPKAGSSTEHIAATSAGGQITILDGANGLAKILIPQATVDAQTFSTAVYDVFAVIAGVPKRLFGGTITRLPNVTVTT